MAINVVLVCIRLEIIREHRKNITLKKRLLMLKYSSNHVQDCLETLKGNSKVFYNISIFISARLYKSNIHNAKSSFFRL